MSHPLFLHITDKIAQLQDILEDHLTLSSSPSADIDKDAYDELTSILDSIRHAFAKLRAGLAGKPASLDGKEIRRFNSLVAKHGKVIDSLISGFSLDETQKKTMADFKFASEFLIPEPVAPSGGQYKDHVDDSDDSAVEGENGNEEIGNSVPSSANYTDALQNKSVRFKQNLIESSPPKLFKPYRDNIDEELDIENDSQDMSKGSNSSSSNSGYKDSLFETMSPESSEIDNPPIDLSNRQIFIHNQQQFVHQDGRLDELHNSIKQQREISMHINRETNDQFVLLNDLERGVESSNTRLIRSNNKLQQYRDALKKRGDWMCIIILTFVLLVLLVILK